MKRIMLFLLFITLPAAFSHAEPLDSLCERIGECLDDVTRLEEGCQLLEQAFGRADVEHDPFYTQLKGFERYAREYYLPKGKAEDDPTPDPEPQPEPDVTPVEPEA